MDKRDVAGVRAVAAQVVKTAQTCHAQARSRAMIMEAAYEQVQTSTPPTQLAVSLQTPAADNIFPLVCI